MSRRHNIRRSGGGGGGGGSGGGLPFDQQVANILGSSFVALWTSQPNTGIVTVSGDVDTWTSTGPTPTTVTALSGPTRMTYTVDGTNFRSQLVPGAASAADRRLVNASAPNLIPSGSRPGLFVVGRLTAFTGVSRWVFSSRNTAGNTTILGIVIDPGSVLLAEVAGGVVSGSFPDTNVHFFSAYLDSAGVRHLDVDNAAFASGGTGISTTVDMGQVAIGSLLSQTNRAQDAFIACVGLANPAPTPAQFTALYAASRATFGF